MLSDYLFFKALMTASGGGGSTEDSGGAKAAIYRLDGEYPPAIENSIKFSNHYATADEIANGLCLVYAKESYGLFSMQEIKIAKVNSPEELTEDEFSAFDYDVGGFSITYVSCLKNGEMENLCVIFPKAAEPLVGTYGFHLNTDRESFKNCNFLFAWGE